MFNNDWLNLWLRKLKGRMSYMKILQPHGSGDGSTQTHPGKSSPVGSD